MKESMSGFQRSFKSLLIEISLLKVKEGEEDDVDERVTAREVVVFRIDKLNLLMKP